MSTSSISSLWSPDHGQIANDLIQFLAWSYYHLPNRDNHLNAALHMHGLARTDASLPYEYWQTVLINHLFNGFCFSGSGPACSAFHAYPSHTVLRRDICFYFASVQPPPSIDGLLAVCVALGFPQTASRGGQARSDIVTLFLNLARAQDDAQEHPELKFFLGRDITRSRSADLHLWLRQHGVPAAGSHDQMLHSLFSHIVTGACIMSNPAFEGCKAVRTESERVSKTSPVHPTRHLLYLANLVMQCKSPSAVQRFLSIYGVPRTDAALALNMEDLLAQVDSLRRPLQHALLHPMLSTADTQLTQRSEKLDELRSAWPQVPSQSLKDESVARFRAATSSDALRSRACASCGASVLMSDSLSVNVHDINMDLFKPTGLRRGEAVPFPLPFADHPTLGNAVLEPTGVEFLTTDSASGIMLHICGPCHQSIASRKVPRLALANSLYPGAVPDVLKNLTIVEESLIARARARCMVVQLQYDFDSPSKSPINQRAIRGNVVVFPQHPEALPFLLPPSIEDILEYVCVVFVGSQLPEPQWFQRHAYPLLIRPDRVRKALEWLKAHNKLYENVRLNEETLKAIPLNGLLPYHVEHVLPSAQQKAATSGYDPDNPAPSSDPDARVPFPSLVVANVGRNAKSSQLRSAALRHVRENRGAFIAVPHDPFFVNEFSNPHLFPSLYPTLFPYGVAGIEDAGRRHRVSFESHVKHLLSLHDRRFQEHPSFLFTAFNIAQRRTMLRSVQLQTRRSRFKSIAQDLMYVSADTVHSVATYLKHAKDGAVFFQPSNEEELLVQKLMYQVNYVSRGVPGTNSSRLAMRNEIRAMVISIGVPQLFITLNPADNRNPIVKFLAGADIDIDDLLDGQVPEYWQQSCLVAKNPFVAAKFFNLYVKAFISEILRWKAPAIDDFASDNTRMGIFGVTRGFYGAVEAQGRGTLHVHMVVWCEGGQNPNELKERLMQNPDFAARFTAFAEDAISTSLPEDPGPDVDVQSNHHHPCSVRGPKLGEDTTAAMHAKDLYNVVEQCQTHEHKPTCYKYWNGPPEPKTCRFDLDPSFRVAESRIDPETGEFTVRHENGMINNFNDTIIRALRNNMDIKIIGSGESAKAIVFYITDYISKSQLKLHVAFSALEQALRKLEDSGEQLDDAAKKGKRILQKCAYEMLGRQEMSAPQVASVLMDYEDHFTSHKFRCLFWTSAETYVEAFLNSSSGTTKAPHILEKECPTADLLPTQNTSGDAPSVQRELDISEDDGGDGSQEDLRNEDPGLDEQRDEDEGVETGLDLDDDVVLEVGEDGELTPRASQLRDYLYRGQLLDDVSLWDFVARVTKARCSKTGRDAPTMDAVQESASFFGGINILECATADRPMCQLLPSHDEHKTSYLTVCHPLEEFVPVLIGPALPRRDRSDVHEKYCRLMLIFFKPWRRPSDLRGEYPSWDLAFEAFKSSPLCTSHISHKLANMQVFHECKDSRDEHYRNRRSSGPGFSSELTDRDDINVFTEDTFEGQDGDVDDRLMSSMLKKLNATFSRKENRVSERVLQVLDAAADAGIVHSSNMRGFEDELSQVDADSTLAHIDVSETGNVLERQWKVSYRDRSTQWKFGAGEDDPDEGEEADDSSTAARPPRPDPTPLSPTVLTLNAMSTTAKEQIRDQTARDWTLNKEQEFAFRTMANQMISPSDSPLRMLVGGAAGTGKTRVIDALRDFVGRLGQEHRILLSSFMGIAAKNISGVTLHSALNLGKLSRMKPYGKMHQELISLWEEKDWLIVDEVSMLSLSLLYDINEGLQLAKESDAPFGGINIVFLGDFAQLPPVAQARLYSILEPSKAKKATINAQKQAFGKLLWLTVDTVCFLTEIKRQEGEENRAFVEMLGRLRVAACTDTDYDLLNSRLLSEIDAKLFERADSPWREAPIIVTENAAKDALNEACAIQFALDNKRELHWYHAKDFHHGKEIVNESLRQMLSHFDSGRTNQRLAKIPLCIGMPVIVSQNFDVQHGIVNGTRGIVKYIRYTTNSAGERCLTSCVITVDGDTGSAMYGLEVNEMPILCDQVTIDIHNSKTRENFKFQRQQAAILPAFAMTAHRAQGQTMPRVIVDLESCKTIEAAYVMVSRAKSLDGILVLRPFAKSRINGKQPDGLPMELHRLEVLSLKTRLKLGTPEERVEARRDLEKLERVRVGSTDIPAVKDSVVTRNKRDLSQEEALVLKLQQQAAAAFGAPQAGMTDIDVPKQGRQRQKRKRVSLD